MYSEALYSLRASPVIQYMGTTDKCFLESIGGVQQVALSKMFAYVLSAFVHPFIINCVVFVLKTVLPLLSQYVCPTIFLYIDL